MKLLLRRLGSVFAVLGLGATMSLVVVNAPAQAATIINVSQSITVPGLVAHHINIHLPMIQYDAQGYINNGARIQVTCWGSDPIGDESISGCPDPYRGGPVTYSGSQLTATEDGVHLDIFNLYEVGTTLNEDWGFRDEIFVRARWIDGDGAVLNGRSNQVNGWF
jgi:hypothetical protein